MALNPRDEIFPGEALVIEGRRELLGELLRLGRSFGVEDVADLGCSGTLLGGL